MNTKKLENIDFINSKFILTPNKVEFKRLFDKFFENDCNLFNKNIDYDNEQNIFFDLIKENKGKKYILCI